MNAHAGTLNFRAMEKQPRAQIEEKYVEIKYHRGGKNGKMVCCLIKNDAEPPSGAAENSKPDAKNCIMSSGTMGTGSSAKKTTGMVKPCDHGALKNGKIVCWRALAEEGVPTSGRTISTKNKNDRDIFGS